jgi:hypothetical protein
MRQSAYYLRKNKVLCMRTLQLGTAFLDYIGNILVHLALKYNSEKAQTSTPLHLIQYIVNAYTDISTKQTFIDRVPQQYTRKVITNNLYSLKKISPAICLYTDEVPLGQKTHSVMLQTTAGSWCKGKL